MKNLTKEQRKEELRKWGIEKPDFPKIKENVKTGLKNPKKTLHDFWYGKEHGERRLGDLYIQPYGLYKHREWRGVKDTFYYFNRIWLYNYIEMVADILKSDEPISFFKALWRYRWLGQTYIPVLHWFDRGLEGLRGEALKASAWHYRAMVSETIRQFMRMAACDTRLHDDKENDLWKNTLAHNETVSGSIFYGWRDRMDDVPLEMIPYFVTVHVNADTVLNYIDAIQVIGLPSDPCPMCQAESGIGVMDDYPDYSPLMITSNEACDGSVSTSIIQDWFLNRPLYAMPQPMRYDDPLVLDNCAKEIEGAWKFIEEQTGEKMDWDTFIEHVKGQNESLAFEHEKWDVAANTDNYPINGVAQSLYRIYYSQDGDRPIWHETDKKVKKILDKCVDKDIKPFPKTRHRMMAWSCAPMYYSYWSTWLYNCWGINVIMNMDSLMFNKTIRTDTYDHAVKDLAEYNMMAPMRTMAVGGYKHIFELWDYMKQFNCDMVMMYDQVQCKGMQGIHGMFEDEFRDRDIHAIWFTHALDDRRTTSRREIRNTINDYMMNVMHEEPLDPSLLDFDDGMSW